MARPYLKLSLIFIGFLIISGCQKVTPPTPLPTPVTVVEIYPQTIPVNFEYIGVAQSSHIVQIRARVEGYLDSIDYQEGGLVQLGQLLFQIDPRPFQATLNQAKALLEKQKALLWNANEKVHRYRPLYEKNAISQKDLDDAISQQLAFEAEVEAAKANVDSAALNLSFTQIQAPVTALSDQAKYREGALISPGPNSLLTNLYVLDPIWVNFSVAESDLLRAKNDIANGSLKWPENMNFKIDVILSDGSKLPSQGYVDFADPSLQQNTGTMEVRAVLANPDRTLKPGAYAKVIVKGAVRPDAIIVPQTAVQQGQKGLFVFVVDQNNKAQMRSIEAGNWYQDSWIILSGLQSGDLVVTEGVNKIKPGSTVNIVKKDSQAPAAPPKPSTAPNATKTRGKKR